jgi:hypothetical protein
LADSHFKNITEVTNMKARCLCFTIAFPYKAPETVCESYYIVLLRIIQQG